MLAVFVALGLFVRSMVTMPGESFRGAPPLPDAATLALAESLKRSVEHLAVDIGERNLSRAPKGLAAARDWLSGELAGLGYAVTPQRYEVKGVAVENLSVERAGSSLSKELVVVGAHYDSALGTPGADDNASGVAVALELARRFAASSPARTVRFVFFTNEEPPHFRDGTMGSLHAAEASRKANEDIRAMLSLETIGYFDDREGAQHYPWPLSSFYPSTGGFIAFVGDRGSGSLVRRAAAVFRRSATVASEGASVFQSIEGVDWSDHGSYWKHGYPAFMVTDTAPFRNPNYHRATDLPPTVDFPRLARVTLGLEQVVRALAEGDAEPAGAGR